jgi:hypothetical protein
VHVVVPMGDTVKALVGTAASNVTPHISAARVESAMFREYIAILEYSSTMAMTLDDSLSSYSCCEPVSKSVSTLLE